ncbi:Fic/DOC family N-terminal domain-containing protein [Actinophytocola sp.]|uniref:Fic family protein n=1 Tax=Actinophytocola sp. TaxID=1872138 RepID=UPI0025BE8FDE|nr:Fic/DOC family N-terminal domain-containing protein [Actinophytocola sp.]
MALSEADAAIGYLQGLGKLIRDPDLLIGPFLTREAVASSRIEGTRASLSDVLKAGEEEGEGEDRSDDIGEVVRYLHASRRGLELIKSLPITQRLITEVHKCLLTGVRGEERQPGELRRSPVWIGAGTHTLETAQYVAPAPNHLGELLTDWERFVNTPSRIPVLVRCALMHYQFETIHPFLDENGRIGRLLVGLMLISEGRLTTPLLYLSGYLESHRSEYYERLQAIRERGEMQEWIKFFLRAIKEQASDAAARAIKLVELREMYLDQSKSDPSRISAIVPLIFRNPFISVPVVMRATKVSDQGHVISWLKLRDSDG